MPDCPHASSSLGMPLTIVLGTLTAVLLFPSAGWAAAALIASILAPTDSALGLAIFTDPRRSRQDPACAQRGERAE